MKKIIITIAILIFVSGDIARGQTFTEGEIEAAIAQGLKERGRLQGLALVDVTSQVSAAIVSSFETLKPSNRPATAALGYSVLLYSPLSWIKQQASDAAKEYRPFTRADVTPAMLAPVLRAVVHPSTPINFTSGSMNQSSSVEHVGCQ